jgi:uncharacterized membrane protein
MINFSSIPMRSGGLSWRVTAIGFRIMLLVVISLGLFWRFGHLDRKVYWLDEAFTSFHLSGYSDQEVTQTIVNGSVFSVKDLHKYQFPTPQKTVAQTIQHIAATAPELPPLYFVLLRSWVEIFGDTIAVIRSFSAVLSLLIFPAVYWFCGELFKSPTVGQLAIGLIAVSPFQVICAQEARPYTLWITLSFCSSAALLRALRLQTRSGWALYIAVTGLGLYTHLLTILVGLAHASYVALMERWRLTKLSLAYLKAAAIAAGLFLPWIFYSWVHRFDMANDAPLTPKSATALTFIKGWVRSISLFFVDFSFDETTPWPLLVGFGILVVLGLALVRLALVQLWHLPRSQRWFLLLLMMLPTAILFLSDLVLSETRSTVARYLLPSYVALQITVAALFAHKINSRHRQHWRRVFSGVIVAGMLSCFVMTGSPWWWNKAGDRLNTAVTTTVNQSVQPLLVSDAFFVKILALSHNLKAHVQLQLVKSPQVPMIPAGFSDVWLYEPSPQLQQALQAKYHLTPIHPPVLWRVTGVGQGEQRTHKILELDEEKIN